MPSGHKLVVPEPNLKPVVTVRVHLPDDPENISKTKIGPKLRKVQAMVVSYAGIHFRECNCQLTCAGVGSGADYVEWRT